MNSSCGACKSARRARLTDSGAVALTLLALWGFVMLIVGKPSTGPHREIVAERTDR
jgi:hypothetical protein